MPIQVIKLKILVTGGAGYVGSILITELIKEHYVRCLDRFFFGKEYLSKLSSKNLELIDEDIRWFNSDLLKDIDIVIDLAAISNDPSAELEPKITYDINYLGRSRVARLSKKYHVKKYILASTASVYGFQKDVVNENSKVNPLTTYSKANRLAELKVLPLNDSNFSTTVLRFGTIYGISPRMRFDLAINTMTYSLFSTKKIVIDGDGKQSRPFVHVKDAVQAYQKIINAPNEIVGGEIFNVGSEEQNLKIISLAKEITNSIGLEHEIIHRGANDHRSYIASFKKIQKKLNFSAINSIKDGAREIYNALELGRLEHSKKTITLDWYKYLIKKGVLTNKLLSRNA